MVSAIPTARATNAILGRGNSGGSTRKSDDNHMIEPKPKTVLELLEGHPERLVKNPHKIAETESGYEIDPELPNAVRWCLMGAMQFVYGDQWGQAYTKFHQQLEVDPIYGCTGFLDRNRDNFPAIIAAVRAAGI